MRASGVHLLIKHVRESLGSLQGKKVLDLFSGAGNFSLPIAGGAREIIAVEENPSAVADGERNLTINHIDNVRFFRSPVDSFNVSDYYPVDVAILDPPRAGLSERVTGKVLEAHPETIVYVSCNPSTFARDLKKLAGRYVIESVGLIDLFPQTYHLESLAFLRIV